MDASYAAPVVTLPASFVDDTRIALVVLWPEQAEQPVPVAPVTRLVSLAAFEDEAITWEDAEWQ